MEPTQERSLALERMDPTALTTAQVQREVAHLEKQVGIQIASIEKSIEVAHADLVRVPTDVDKQIAQVKALNRRDIEVLREIFKQVDVKFAGVEQRFLSLEEMRRELKIATETAVAAALQAAKEAVGEQTKNFTLSIDKSEAATVKQIDAQADTLKTALQAHETQISDAKERLTKIESMGLGSLKEFSDVNYGSREAQAAAQAAATALAAANQSRTLVIVGLAITVVLSFMGTAASIAIAVLLK